MSLFTEQQVLRYKKYLQYMRIHNWLGYHYSSATYCESITCKGISKMYHFCLKKGCIYEKKRENFIQLCSSCHRLYDMNDEMRKNISEGQKGRIFSAEHIRKLILNNKRKGQPSPFKGQHHPIERLKQMSESQVKRWLERKIRKEVGFVIN